MIHKPYPIVRLTFPFFLFSLLGFFVSCGNRQAELESRMLAQLVQQNNSLEQATIEKIQDRLKELNELKHSGNTKWEYCGPYLASLAVNLRHTSERLSNLAEATGIADSILKISAEWNQLEAEFRKVFEFDSLHSEKPDVIADRFSKENKENLPIELELVRARFIENSFEMVDVLRRYSTAFVCNWDDSLMLMEIPFQNSVVAGETAEIGLVVTRGLWGIDCEFGGSGNVSFDPNGFTARMKIPTNIQMLQEGQKENFVSYSAWAKVPKVDGTYEKLPATGKIRIVRNIEN